MVTATYRYLLIPHIFLLTVVILPDLYLNRSIYNYPFSKFPVVRGTDQNSYCAIRIQVEIPMLIGI
jgi:hypothetical protein